MTISRTRWMLLCVAGAIAASLVSATWAKDELPKALRSALAEESQISRSDWSRRQQLGEELVKAKNFDEELRWQAGFVKVNGNWLPFEESFSPEPINGVQREYLDRRSKAEQTSKSQTELAAWCSKRGLGEQSQVHYFRAIRLSAPNVDVSHLYRLMHYVRVGQNWLSPYEAIEAKTEAKHFFGQLEQFALTCQRFGEELESGRMSDAVRRNRLTALATEERVPALEAILGSRSEVSGLAAVEAIGQVTTHRATEALGRMAVLSPWLFVRDRAIAELTSRKKEEYIPQWLNFARAPIRTEFQQLSSGWNLGFVFVMAEEGESDIRIAKTTIVAEGALRPGGFQGINSLDDSLTPLNANRLGYLRRLNVRLLAIDDWKKNVVDPTNEQREFLNERVAVALKETTGGSAGHSPQEWWNWWREQSGFEPVSQKTVVIVNEETEIRPAPSASCLVAGTPIWTKHGLVAVERIQPGDRVLSKNVETGELAYKVVLHTTVREAFPVTKFAIGDESIQATAGHHFWVSGRGWTKTRELAAEQPLHTPAGIVRVASTESADSAPTYNLVVADFHTYFVGKSAILSHDVLPPKPTNKVVPGLEAD